jgi:hypothetical protein
MANFASASDLTNDSYNRAKVAINLIAVTDNPDNNESSMTWNVVVSDGNSSYGGYNYDSPNGNGAYATGTITASNGGSASGTTSFNTGYQPYDFGSGVIASPYFPRTLGTYTAIITHSTTTGAASVTGAAVLQGNENPVGYASASTGAKALTDFTGPGTPTDPTASRVSGTPTSISVTSTAVSAGSASITAYQYSYGTTSAADTTVGNLTLASRTGTISGLTATQGYYVKTRAISWNGGEGSWGYGAWSPAVFVAGIPSNPTNVSASRSARSVTVTYTAPATNGGLAGSPTIYVYRNKRVGGSWSGWTYHNNTDVLDLASEYKFGVQAANISGTSSIVEYLAVPLTDTGIIIPAIPTTPTKVSLTRSNKKITFDWTDSTWDANDTGNKYYQLQVTSSTDNANWNGWSDVSTTLTASTYTTADLVNATYYKYQVKAVSPTGVGDSAWLASGTMYIPAVPTTPTITTYGRSARVITFDWTDSTWDSNTISSDSGTNTYTLQVATSSDGSTWGAWSTLSSTGTTSTYTSGTLNLATYYKYQVKANGNTGIGDSAWLATSAIYISNASPAPVINTPLAKNVRKVTVDWNAIVPAAGSTVTGYELETRYSSDNGATWDSAWTNIASTNATTTIFTTADLNIAKTYQFRVRALTDVVASDYSDTTSLTVYNSIFISAYGYRFNGTDWTTAIQNAWRYTGNTGDKVTLSGTEYSGWVVVQSVQKNTSTGFTSLEQ